MLLIAGGVFFLLFFHAARLIVKLEMCDRVLTAREASEVLTFLHHKRFIVAQSFATCLHCQSYFMKKKKMHKRLQKAPSYLKSTEQQTLHVLAETCRVVRFPLSWRYWLYFFMLPLSKSLYLTQLQAVSICGLCALTFFHKDNFNKVSGYCYCQWWRSK